MSKEIKIYYNKFGLEDNPIRHESFIASVTKVDRMLQVSSFTGRMSFVEDTRHNREFYSVSGRTTHCKCYEIIMFMGKSQEYILYTSDRDLSIVAGHEYEFSLNDRNEIRIKSTKLTPVEEYLKL